MQSRQLLNTPLSPTRPRRVILSSLQRWTGAATAADVLARPPWLLFDYYDYFMAPTMIICIHAPSPRSLSVYDYVGCIYFCSRGHRLHYCMFGNHRQERRKKSGRSETEMVSKQYESDIHRSLHGGVKILQCRRMDARLECEWLKIQLRCRYFLLLLLHKRGLLCCEQP